MMMMMMTTTMTKTTTTTMMIIMVMMTTTTTMMLTTTTTTMTTTRIMMMMTTTMVMTTTMMMMTTAMMMAVHRCEKPCRSGFWGLQCQQQCACVNADHCQPTNGRCMCQPGKRDPTKGHRWKVISPPLPPPPNHPPPLGPRPRLSLLNSFAPVSVLIALAAD